MYDICEVAITASDPDWLADLTRQLVDTGLVACAHVTPIRVIYRPQGEVHDHVQSRAALHTRRGNVLAIVERVNRDHPDAAPCIIALPIADGDNAYMQWVRNQARPHRDLRHEVSIISTTGACPNSPTHPPRRKT